LGGIKNIKKGGARQKGGCLGSIPNHQIGGFVTKKGGVDYLALRGNRGGGGVFFWGLVKGIGGKRKGKKKKPVLSNTGGGLRRFDKGAN